MVGKRFITLRLESPVGGCWPVHCACCSPCTPPSHAPSRVQYRTTHRFRPLFPASQRALCRVCVTLCNRVRTTKWDAVRSTARAITFITNDRRAASGREEAQVLRLRLRPRPATPKRCGARRSLFGARDSNSGGQSSWNLQGEGRQSESR